MSSQVGEALTLLRSDTPNNKSPTAEKEKDSKERKTPITADKEWKMEIIWRNVFIYIYFHIAFLYGAYLLFTKAMWATRLFTLFLYLASGLGITAGVHRLWSHCAFKANLPLRAMLVFFNTIAFQNSIIDWARDHRTHHKHSETDADPHNAARGFFFSHVGWLLVKKHPEIKAKGQAIDVGDLLADPLLRFQKRYYSIIMPICCFILPTIIPTLWGESLWTAYFVCAMFRWVWVLNGTWLVNSAAHMFGNKPYDKHIKPTEIKSLSLLVFGEGFHNYHHTFPWDYKSTELGGYLFNFTNLFIDLMVWLGWAYDLKTVTPEMVKQRVEKTGDGTHHLWGWNDKDVSVEDKNITTIVNPEKNK